MRLFALFAALVLAASAPRAECVGQNLIDALPPDQRHSLQAAAASVPFATGNLWLATRNSAQITLVGTYHLDDPRHRATLDTLSPALAQASALLVEAGPEEEARIVSETTRNPGLLFDFEGTRLDEVLGKAAWDRLSRALLDRNLPPPMSLKMRPWYVMTLLSVPACQIAQASAANGLDKQLMAKAKAADLPIVALEPWDTIFHVFGDLPKADQLSLLVQAIDEAAAGDDMAVTLSDAYFAGENRLLWEFSKFDAQTRSGLSQAEVEREFALMEEVMMTRRNQSWLAPIKEAAARGPIIVAVGALHLSGEAGLLNLLAQDGWTITALAP